MASYRMSDGTVVKTENATAKYEESRYHNGSNMIGVSSGSQWVYESLYRSRRGRYWIESCKMMQGAKDTAEWVSNEEAARWLLLNEIELPEELQSLVEEVSE